MTPEILTLDFETYYDQDFTLSKMSTSEYVYDPRFEVIGVGLRRGDMRVWLEEHQFRALAKQLPWESIALLAHHAQFDGLILSHHYDIKPGYWLDTLSMARAIHGEAVAADLDSLMKRYGVGFKGHEVVAAKGKHRADFTQAEWLQYGGYCKNDCDGTYDIFHKMLPGFPQSELGLIDITVRMFTEPTLVLDEPKMQEYLAWEINRKEELLAKISAGKEHLGSSPKFAALLTGMGIEPPMKDSPTSKNPDGTPKRIFAFAKTDPAFQELLVSEDTDVRLLCEARLGTKSAGNESRSARLLTIGANQRPLPVYLKYAGAGTYRWSGGDKCLVADTIVPVFDSQKGFTDKRIVDILLDDLVWDGVAYVAHDGVKFAGYAEVMTHDNLTGTADHVVFTEVYGEITLAEAMSRGATIVDCPEPTGRRMDAA